MQAKRAARGGVAPVVIAHPRPGSLDVNSSTQGGEPVGALQSTGAYHDTIKRTVRPLRHARGLDSAGGEPRCVWRGAAGPVSALAAPPALRVDARAGVAAFERELLRAHADRIAVDSKPRDGSRFYRNAVEIEELTVTQTHSTREHLIETYRKKAKHYDITSRFYPVPGYPQRAQRLRAVQALGLRPGDSVVEIACGTGLNFSLIEQVIGPDGRIIGVDLTDAMLAQAQHRIETHDWSNISLVQADAAEFDFPTEVDAILSTYALSHVPECGEVIAHGAAALSRGGRWVVLDLKIPDRAPRWPAQLGVALARRFGSIDEWIARRPWEAIRVAMQDTMADLSWTELFFGTAFLAAGSRGTGTVNERPQGSGHA
jgi:ubiquinone/menaquinone biosynthesis C-methylase UbiE